MHSVDCLLPLFIFYWIVFYYNFFTFLWLRVSTHWTILTCLDVEHCITLLHLTLLEQKVVLHSYRPALLTSGGEAIRSILFPLQWQCTYIPMCPLAFASYLQAPVPFLIGGNGNVGVTCMYGNQSPFFV